MSPALAAALQLALVVAVLAVLYVPLGDHMARTYTSRTHLRVERIGYRMVRVDPDADQSWKAYAASVLAFTLVSILGLYLLQRVQGVLPLSNGLAGVSPSVAFNTAISFATNTNWQSYVPETTMGHLTQMIGLTVQNFLSASVGMAVAVALIRGIVAVRGGGLGNFWVDLTRGVVRILLPLSIIVAIILLTQGVIMSLHTSFTATGLDGSTSAYALAPVASQEAIKELGTNGGGVLNTNSAHPFENPTPLSNVVEVIALLLIPVCLTRTFGTMVRDRRQGTVLLAVMGALWAAQLAVGLWAESSPHGVAAQAAGAMLEGKEVRFGIPSSVLFAVSTTGTSTGAVNSMHDSYTGLGGGGLLLNMLFGEIAPGGVGSGLFGILVLAVIAVFVGGLLVGRTPEYLGKKIGRREITMAALSILVMPALVLICTAVAVVLPSTSGALGNSGDPGTPGAIHGFSEVLYAFASAANNNGSAFAGITVTNDFFQIALGLAMLLGRLLPIVFILALAGSLAEQTPTPASTGTLPTRGVQFGVLLVGVVILVAALTFFPALALGPIAEALV
ncbi:potassium-transporting ATPase subunit KdpA [Nakamurella leprariae]|uniref:Potassium-transporting ATPase potassium-binding subunit n=1 Tax=Nakamurella leprariae TaxID=2803911 RepID=A0A939BX67_9ACTN|nr:potassium-transporting ATPase subunit KdpA [Nakamurella leprariae]MBM9468248.1 potassium-transporting ATPase subunit KdpA [Nakamurella leprariae]